MIWTKVYYPEKVKQTWENYEIIEHLNSKGCRIKDDLQVNQILSTKISWNQLLKYRSFSNVNYDNKKMKYINVSLNNLINLGKIDFYVQRSYSIFLQNIEFDYIRFLSNNYTKNRFQVMKIKLNKSKYSKQREQINKILNSDWKNTKKYMSLLKILYFIDILILFDVDNNVTKLNSSERKLINSIRNNVAHNDSIITSIKMFEYQYVNINCSAIKKMLNNINNINYSNKWKYVKKEISLFSKKSNNVLSSFEKNFEVNNVEEINKLIKTLELITNL